MRNVTKQSSKTNLGFSLIEMLVAAAITVVIALGLMQMTSNNVKAQKGVQDSSDLNSFGTALQQILGQNAGCTANLALRGTPPGSQAITFDASSSQFTVLQTTVSGQPIISEIDYPILQGTTYVPNTNSPLVATSGTAQNWQNWQVTQIGLRVLGQEAPNLYNVSIEVDFKKINTQSYGGSTGLRQATALLVATTPASGTLVTVTGCGSTQSSIIAYAADPTSQATNGIGGTTGNCQPNNVGPFATFPMGTNPSESVTFTLTGNTPILIHYNAFVGKNANDSTGTGLTYLNLDGTQLTTQGTSLFCENSTNINSTTGVVTGVMIADPAPPPAGIGCAGSGATQTVEFLVNATAGSHTVSVQHSVDCGTVYWKDRVLTATSL